MSKLSSERKQRILEKFAEEESRILKALPGIGAIVGGLYGAKNPKVVFSALKGRLPSAIAGIWRFTARRPSISGSASKAIRTSSGWSCLRSFSRRG